MRKLSHLIITRRNSGSIIRPVAHALLAALLAGSLAAQPDAESEASHSDPDENSSIQSERIIYRVSIKGPITPSAMESLSEAIEQAEAAQARALLLVLDTPGGLVTSMDDMIRDILSSQVPVITYVGPPGATCGSAGVYIMYASHVAAMAPATNIGSATPVQVGGGGMPGQEQTEEGNPSDRIPETAGADDELNMKRKLLNHARAQMRSLADFHGRNGEFAVRSITHAENLTSREALQINAIDLMADTESELLAKLDGRTVRMSDGRQSLDLEGATVVPLEIDFRRRVLNILTNPNVAMILMMLGILGIFAEIYHPGAIFPGAFGAVCLLLGLYAMQSLSVDYTGLALIGLGIVFFILEFSIMSYGLLSIGGTLCLILGSLMMMRSGSDFLGASAGLIIFMGLLTGALMAAVIYVAARSQGKAVVSGVEQLRGAIGEARTSVGPGAGQIFIHSEIWQARSGGAEIPAGARVRVTEVRGLTLMVEAVEEDA